MSSKKNKIWNKFKTFMVGASNEFKDGMNKLVGWVIPLTIFGLIFSLLIANTINNELKINSFTVVESKDDYIHDGNDIEEKGFSSVVKEFNIGEDRSISKVPYYSMTHTIKVEGKGKIKSAYIAYSPGGNEEVVVTPLEVNNEIFSKVKRIYSVSPSKLSARITINIENIDDQVYQRAYLFLEDAETNNYNSALLLINPLDTSAELKIIDMKKVLALVPNDPKIKIDLYYSKHNSEIKKEYSMLLKNLK